jgi:transcriptional regulator with XRE-family HTH domain
VAGRGDPSALRWLIGTELLNARKKAKVSQKAAGEAAGCSHVNVSYMEKGTTVQEPARITKLMKRYGSDQADIDRLARLAGSYADQGAWWADFADVVPDWLATFVGLEGLASAEFVYDPLVLPGPVQIREYAEALLVDHLRVAAADVPEVVALRMARQEPLVTGENSLEFVTVIEESTLDRMVGGPDVMRRQYQHLLELDQRANITLLMMPSEVAVHDGLDGELMLLDFREAQSIAYMEFQDGAVYIQDQDRVKKYDFTRKRMCSRATPAAPAIKDRLDRLAA